FFLDAEQVGQAELLQRPMNGRRKGADDLLEVCAQVEVSAFDASVQVGAFLQQGSGQQGNRQNHQQQNQQHGQQSAKIGPAWQAGYKPAVQGHEADGQYGAPEHGGIVRQQQPAERERDNDQQDDEGAIVQFAIVHEGSG